MKGFKLAYRYKMTIPEYEALLASQDGRCAICRTDQQPHRGWHVDHDHACCSEKARSCGKCVRGLLCWMCNSLLGMAHDDPVVLDSAKAYLERTLCPPQ